MALQIVFGQKLTLTVSPLTWQMMPYSAKANAGSTTLSQYGWLCVSVVVRSTQKQKTKDWSDDEVIREMKALEREVENQKKKPKTPLKGARK